MKLYVINYALCLNIQHTLKDDDTGLIYSFMSWHVAELRKRGGAVDVQFVVK